MLLLLTPPGAFARVVPFLIAAGSLALIAEPWMRALPPSRATRPDRRRAVWAGSSRWGWSSIYGGYFGAGSGVMTLALLLVTLERDLPTANALKNMTHRRDHAAGGDSARDASGPCTGPRLPPLAARALWSAHASDQPSRARCRVTVIRWSVATLGLGLAVWLWVKPSA